MLLFLKLLDDCTFQTCVWIVFQKFVDVDVCNNVSIVDDVSTVACLFDSGKVVRTVQNAITALLVDLHVVVQCVGRLRVQTC